VAVVHAIIDLDDFDKHPEAPPPAPRQNDFTKRLAAAGAALVCLLTLGAGESDPPPAITRMAQVPIPITAELKPAGDLVMLVDGGLVIALDQATARERWRVRTGLVRPAVQVQQSLLTIIGYAENEAPRPGGLRTVVLDPATGAEKWRAPYSLMVVGDVVVGQNRFDSDSGSTGQMSVFDLDGRMLWSRQGLFPQQLFARERRSVITLNLALGRVTEYDLSTGNIKRELTDARLASVDGILDMGQIRFFQNDGPILEWRDSAIVDLGQELSTSETRERYDCVVVWCDGFFGRTGLVDKQTGTALLPDRLWRAAVGTDFGVLGLAFDGDSGANGTLEFYDTARRRLVRLPSIWQLIGDQQTSEPMVKRGPLILLAPGPASTRVAVIDKGGFRVVGSVANQHMAQCASDGYAFSCRTEPHTLTVWRVN
jgi:hypothetical protein